MLMLELHKMLVSSSEWSHQSGFIAIIPLTPSSEYKKILALTPYPSKSISPQSYSPLLQSLCSLLLSHTHFSPSPLSPLSQLYQGSQYQVKLTGMCCRVCFLNSNVIVERQSPGSLLLLLVQNLDHATSIIGWRLYLVLRWTRVQSRY